MLKSIALVASLLANTALLGVLANGQSADAPRPPPGEASGPQTPRAVQAPRDPGGFYARVRALGLAEHEARILLLAEIERDALRKIAPPADRYWDTLRAGHAEYDLAVAAAHATVRGRLEEVFGAAAAVAPEFTRVYRPLDRQFPFLSAGQQIALQTWRLQRRREQAVAPERERSAAAPNLLDELAALRAALPAEAAFEVALRDSALAEDLRAAGTALTEAEFRSTYALLAELEPRDARAHLDARRQLRALLGAERYERIWARRDPLMPIVRRVGREHALSNAAVDAAYGVLNESQERLLDLALGEPPGERSIAAAQSISTAETDRLVGLIGEAAARALLFARTEYFLAASRAGTREPPEGSR